MVTTGGPTRIAVLAVLWEPGLGDLVQRNTFLHLLRQAHPDAEVTHVVGARTADRFAEVLQRHGYASRVLAGPDVGAPDATARAALLDRIRAEAFELAVVDPDSLGLLAEDASRCGIPARIGFATGAADDRFLTTSIRLPRSIFGAPDLVDYACGLASALGLPPPRTADVVAPFPYTAPEGAAMASDLPRPVIAVHPGGAPHWNRRWPARSYAELCARLATADGASIVLLGDAGEAADLAALDAMIVAAAPGATVSVHAGDPLDCAAALLVAADVLVGNDSALAHVAAALDRPAVVIYGPTGTEFFAARAYRHQRGINHRHGCQAIRNLVRGGDIATMPCAFSCTYVYRGPDGPYPHCLTGIGVDEVQRGVRRALAAVPTRAGGLSRP